MHVQAHTHIDHTHTHESTQTHTDHTHSCKHTTDLNFNIKSYWSHLHPLPQAYCNDSFFAYEELSMDTFKDWPHESPAGVDALVRAGIFYTLCVSPNPEVLCRSDSSPSEPLCTSRSHEQLFHNLHKFLGLKELCVRLDGKPDVLSVLPGEFPNLLHMEKLSIRTSMEFDLSKLVKLIQNSSNLHVFHLKCNFLSNCGSLMTALASCKKLREIEFSGRCFEAMTFGKNCTTLTSNASVPRVI